MSGWNKFHVSDYSGMIAETISIPGHGGRYIHAYYSRPTGEGKFPGLLAGLGRILSGNSETVFGTWLQRSLPEYLWGFRRWNSGRSDYENA